MATTTFLQAIHDAIEEEMTTDERVIVIGEDIGAYGGAFKVTEGLLDQFGPQRIIETPIAEAAVVGAAAGAAMYGMRPIAELQFSAVISCAGFDQLVTVAAKSRYRNGVACPMVLRGPSGGGARGGITHGRTDELGYGPVENPVHIHDLNATLLHLLGINHERLTYRYQGRDFRLTDVHGHVIDDIVT